MTYLLTAIELTKYTEQHNETEYPEQNKHNNKDT